MTRVCVLFGGASSEHEVSLRSATCILENLDRSKYEVVMVGITRRGNWYHYSGPIELIADGKWEHSPFVEPALISPDPSEGGLLLLGEKPKASDQVRRKLFADVLDKDAEKLGVTGIRVIPIDVVFPVLHGKNGEDGTLQGLLDMAEIPYVGCGVLSSAACMDKEYMHIILEHAGVPKTDLVAVHPEELADMDALEKRLVSIVGYPMFVKPANAGSSVGISKVEAKEELLPALRAAFEHDHKVVVERTIIGREIECSVWGNRDPVASHALGEIIPTRDFYDYQGKYEDDSAQLVAPAQLEEDIVECVREIAVKAYKAMECSGLARVDFFVQPDGNPVLNEINTLPGFTSISMFPRLFQEDGVEIPELLDNLIDSAFSLSSLDD